MHLGSGNRDRWSLCALLVVVLVVASVVLVPVSVDGQDKSSVGRIITVNETGPAVITTSNDTTYVWQSEQYTASATFQINASQDQYAVCLHENRSDGTSTELDCQSARLGNGSTATVTLNGSNATQTGERTLYFQLRPSFGRDAPTLDSRTINQTVIEKDGDFDNDGLTNEFEIEQTNDANWSENAFLDWDMDGDSLSDGQEYGKPRLDPTQADTDSDGLPDALELSINTNPSDADSDGDGIDDDVEYNDPNLDPTDPNDSSSTTQNNSADDKEGSGGFSGFQLLLLVVVGMGLVGAAVLLWRNENDDDAEPFVSAIETDDGGVSPPSAAETGDDDEILTDEGRVLKLLQENRGRMKQVDVVDETGWSKSKVSRLLSRMEDRGDINRLRVGRGNIVYLDGAKPSGARSPHEDDSHT